MVTLKSTSLSNSVSDIHEDMNKALHDNLYQTRIKLVANLVNDIEALHHGCFQGGLNQIDQNILHRCKQALGATLNDLGLFNVFLYSDVETAITQTISELEDEDKKAWALAAQDAAKHGINPPPQPPSTPKRFVALKRHPRVRLGFKPRAKNDFDELLEDLNTSNNSALRTISEINELISKSEPSTGNEVRRKHTHSNDGFLISINCADLNSTSEVLDRITSFIDTVESLSLDELMIAQQFSSWMKMEQLNPFDLEVTDVKKNLVQSIAISVFNLEEFTASFYVSTLLKNIEILIANSLAKDGSLTLKHHAKSLNSSFLSINLKFAE